MGKKDPLGSLVWTTALRGVKTYFRGSRRQGGLPTAQKNAYSRAKCLRIFWENWYRIIKPQGCHMLRFLHSFSRAAETFFTRGVLSWSFLIKGLRIRVWCIGQWGMLNLQCCWPRFVQVKVCACVWFVIICGSAWSSSSTPRIRADLRSFVASVACPQPDLLREHFLAIVHSTCAWGLPRCWDSVLMK